MAKRFKHTIVNKVENRGHLDTKLSTIDDKLDIPDTTTTIPPSEVPNPVVSVHVNSNLETMYIRQGDTTPITFNRGQDMAAPVVLEIFIGTTRANATRIHTLSRGTISSWNANIITSGPIHSNLYLWAKIIFDNGETRLEPVVFTGTTRHAYYIIREATTTTETTTTTTIAPTRLVLLTVTLANAGEITPFISIRGEDGTGAFTTYSDTIRTLSRYVHAPYVSWTVSDPSGRYTTVSGTETTYGDLTKTIYLQKNTQYADLRIVVSGLTDSPSVTYTISGANYNTSPTLAGNGTIGPIRLPHGIYNITPSRSGAAAITNLNIDGDRTVYISFQQVRTNKSVSMYANVPATFSIYSGASGNMLYQSVSPTYSDIVTEDTTYNGSLVLNPYPNEELRVEASAPGYEAVEPQVVYAGQVYPRFTLNANLPETVTSSLRVTAVDTFLVTSITEAANAGQDYPIGQPIPASGYAYLWDKQRTIQTSYYTFEDLIIPNGYYLESAVLFYTITSAKSTFHEDYNGSPQYERDYPSQNDVLFFQVGGNYQGMANRPRSMDPATIGKDTIYPVTRIGQFLGQRSIALDTNLLVKNGRNVLNIHHSSQFNATTRELRALAALPITQSMTHMAIDGDNMNISLTFRRK